MESWSAAVDAEEHDDKVNEEQDEETHVDVASQLELPSANGAATKVSESHNIVPPVDRKPDDELFVLVDDDLDNDIIGLNSVSFQHFQRNNTFSDVPKRGASNGQQPDVSVSEEELPEPVKVTVTESTKETGTDSIVVSADESDNVVKQSPSADNGKISENPATKRLVCMLNRLPSRLLVTSW